MANIDSLAKRIDAEFSAVEDKVKKLQSEKVEAYEQRRKRVEQLNKVFDELREIWRPRLDYLVGKFGDRVKAKPRIVDTTREAIMEFESHLARIRLKCSAFTDREVQKVILGYDLDIIPVLMRYKRHDEVEFPLNAVNKEAAAKWIDDRIVDFVQTYFSLGENEIYLKDQMVEDPIAHVRFPKIAAATSLEVGGQKFYFVGEETRREFEKQQGSASK
jgi:YHS domain-containing protein